MVIMLQNKQHVKADIEDIIELYENNSMQVFRVLDSIDEELDCYTSDKIKLIKKINVRTNVFSFENPGSSDEYEYNTIWMNVKTKNVYINTPNGWIMLYTLSNNKVKTNYEYDKSYKVITALDNKVVFFPYSVEATQFQVEGTGEILIEER